MKHKSTNNFLLALTALIWGSAFVAQSVGMDYLGPFTFNSIRSVMGGIVLLPVIFILKRLDRKSGKTKTPAGSRKTLIIGGICCGALFHAECACLQVVNLYPPLRLQIV